MFAASSKLFPSFVSYVRSTSWYGRSTGNLTAFPEPVCAPSANAVPGQGSRRCFSYPPPVGRYVSSVFSLPSLVRHAYLLSRCIRHGRPLAACRARYTSPFLTVPATCWRRPELFAFPVVGEMKIPNGYNMVKIEVTNGII